jgi:hypothetical protein
MRPQGLAVLRESVTNRRASLAAKLSKFSVSIDQLGVETVNDIG